MPNKTTEDIFGSAGAEKSGLLQGRASMRNAMQRGRNVYDELLAELSVPELEQMRRSMAAEAAASPESVEAQKQAISTLARLAGSPAITPAEQALLGRITDDQLQTERANREAILANASARGQLGGGSALMAQLAASQNSAERARRQGQDAAAMAQDRFMTSLGQLGSLSSRAREQSFGEAMGRGSAEDARRQYNNAVLAQKFGLQSGLAGQQAGFLSDLSGQQQAAEQARRDRIKKGIGSTLQLAADVGTTFYNPTKALGKVAGGDGNSELIDPWATPSSPRRTW